MRYSAKQMIDLGRLHARQEKSGQKYFPLVLMLEPLHACNLACIGCGRIVEYKDTIRDMMPLDEALHSAEEAGAPIVSICGGEAVDVQAYRGADARADRGIRRRHVMICTNAILLERFVKQVPPSPYLSFNLHLDGMRETNDRVLSRVGHFDIVVKMIKMLKEKGYRVQTNTTVFQRDQRAGARRHGQVPDQPRRRWDAAESRLSLPGAAERRRVSEERRDAGEVFQGSRHGERLQDYHTPIYLDYLVGKRDMQCSPWTTVTRNPQGWKGPCYLITNGHYKTLDEMHAATDWEYIGPSRISAAAIASCIRDLRGTVALEFGKNMKDSWRMVRHYVA